MFNKYYNYGSIGIWDAEAWKGRESVLYPLAMWLEENNGHITRGKGECEKKPDAPKFAKTNTYIYPDVVKRLDEMGITFRHDGLGGQWWIMLAPKSVGKGGNRHPKFLVIFHDTDYADPYWAMRAMDYYKDYIRMAAEEGMCILICATDGRDEDCLYSNVLCEMHAIFHVELDELYVDVSSVYADGKTLKDIPDFVYRDADGSVVPDPDSAVVRLGELGVPALNFTGRWYNRISHTYNVARSPKYFHECFDREKLIHSETGREMAEGFLLEHDALYGDDEVMLRYWREKGLRFERHDCEGEQWIAIAPECAFESGSAALPAFFIYQEVTRCNDFQELIAVANYRRFFELAGNGECIVVFFALETNEDNELMNEVITDALAAYPIDERRVYLVGHSHNSRFAQIFAYNHPDRIAGLGILNGSHGLQDPRRPGGDIVIGEDEISRMASLDMPQVIINGYAESDFTAENVEKHGGEETAIRCWRNRLRACRCPDRSESEVALARKSGSVVERKMGITADCTDIAYVYGHDAYIADIRNMDGRWHLRCVTLENMPHMITPQMPDMLFNYLRRFAREKDGSIAELF